MIKCRNTTSRIQTASIAEQTVRRLGEVLLHTATYELHHFGTQNYRLLKCWCDVRPQDAMPRFPSRFLSHAGERLINPRALFILVSISTFQEHSHLPQNACSELIT